MEIWVRGWITELSGHLGGFLAGLFVSMFFYAEITKYSFMRIGRFAFVVIYGILLAVAIITIFFRNTHRCYANLCRVTLHNPPKVVYG